MATRLARFAPSAVPRARGGARKDLRCGGWCRCGVDRVPVRSPVPLRMTRAGSRMAQHLDLRGGVLNRAATRGCLRCRSLVCVKRWGQPAHDGTAIAYPLRPSSRPASRRRSGTSRPLVTNGRRIRRSCHPGPGAVRRQRSSHEREAPALIGHRLGNGSIITWTCLLAESISIH